MAENDRKQLKRAEIYELVAKYSDRLVLFAYCIVGDYYTAEDTVADAYARLVVKNPAFPSEGALKAYLYKTVRSKAVDSLRRLKHVVRDEDLDQLLTVDGEREIFEREEHRTVYRAIQNLPEQYRNAVCLVYIDGLTVSEACKILKKSQKQLYNLLSRAKNALKDLLKEDLL